MGTNNIPTRLLTAHEVAGILSVSTARVYELARIKAIPALRLGQRQLRFDETALRKWIALAAGRNCAASRDEETEWQKQGGNQQ